MCIWHLPLRDGPGRRRKRNDVSERKRLDFTDKPFYSHLKNTVDWASWRYDKGPTDLGFSSGKYKLTLGEK